MNVVREKNGNWVIKCEGTRQELLDIGRLICSMANEGIGSKKDFSFTFNDVKINPRSSREFWMFGRGLLSSANTFAAKLLDTKLGTVPKKMKPKKKDDALMQSVKEAVEQSPEPVVEKKD